jgi:hypothetical protein
MRLVDLVAGSMMRISNPLFFLQEVMQASKSTTSKRNNKGLEILIIDPATRSTNLIEVTKQLDYYVQQNYKTLFD